MRLERLAFKANLPRREASLPPGADATVSPLRTEVRGALPSANMGYRLALAVVSANLA